MILLCFDIKANPSPITPVNLLCEWLHIFVGRAEFDFFVRFEHKY